MAAYYYVKTGGTAAAATDNGRYASQQTGTFAAIGAAGYYNDIEVAIDATTLPADGDFICCSDLHDFDAGSATIWYAQSYSPGPTNINLVSVDDANCENYKAGATERQSSGLPTIIFATSFHLWGMNFESMRWTQMTVSGAEPVFNECNLSIAGAYNFIIIDNGLKTTLRDCTLTYGDAVSTYISVQKSAIFHMYGGDIASSAGGDGFVDYLFYQGFNNDSGGTAYIEGVDLSIIDGTLLADVGGDGAVDFRIDVHIHNCKLHASVAYTNETFQSPSHKLLITNCGSSTSGAEYQYHYETRGVTVDDETSFYRNNSTAFPSGQQTALKVVTNTLVSRNKPAVFDFPIRYAELSDTASDTLRIYILSSTTLTDTDVWIEVSYPDGTNTHWGNHVDSGNPISGGFSQEPFATGTTLTTNTEGWTGRVAENRYHIDIDTSGDVGADCYPTIRVYIAKVSSTIYFCPSVELV